MEMLDRGMIRVPGGAEHDGARFQHTARDDLTLRNCFFLEFPTSYFQMTVTETMESETRDKEGNYGSVLAIKMLMTII